MKVSRHTAAVFAASPALAINWADRTWGAKHVTCCASAMAKQKPSVLLATRWVFSGSAANPRQSALYVMNNCLDAYMDAPDY